MPTGEIEYHGRVDTQVKIRGNRIELGEIEAVLLEQPSIGQAVVTTWQPDPDRTELVAYYTVRSDAAPPSRAEIARELKKRLPDFMVPSFLQELPVLPMTVSDKVDLRQLPPPTTTRVAANSPVVAPRDEAERFIVKSLGEVLKRDEVSVEAHFFDDLGANSLLMARLCARLRTREGWATASMRDIYLYPTASQLAVHLRRQAGVATTITDRQPTYRASNLVYWTCGVAQLAFYLLYSFAWLWCFNTGCIGSTRCSTSRSGSTSAARVAGRRSSSSAGLQLACSASGRSSADGRKNRSRYGAGAISASGW